MSLLSSLASALNCKPIVQHVVDFASNLNDENDQEVISAVAGVLNTEYQAKSCESNAQEVNDAIQRAMDDGSLVDASDEPAPEESAPEEPAPEESAPAEIDVQQILNDLSAILHCDAEANTILNHVTKFYGRHPNIQMMDAVATLLGCDCNPNAMLVTLHSIFQI